MNVRAPRYPILSDEQLQDFVLAHKFKFARSLPYSPHSYVTLDRARDPQELQRVAATVRSRGYEEVYNRETYLCLDVPTPDGVAKIWPQPGDPTGEITLINRGLKGRPGPRLLQLARVASMARQHAEEEGDLRRSYRIHVALAAAMTGDWTYANKPEMQAMLEPFQFFAETLSISEAALVSHRHKAGAAVEDLAAEFAVPVSAISHMLKPFGRRRRVN